MNKDIDDSGYEADIEINKDNKIKNITKFLKLLNVS